MSKPIPVSQEEYGIYLSCLNPTLAYNLPLLIPVGKASFENIESSLNKILEAHPHLNVKLFQKGDDICKEEVKRPLELSKSEYDPKKEAELVKPFDLLKDSLYRFVYLEGEENYLFADFHHILMDGFSLRIFFNELDALLNGKTIEKETLSAEEDSRKKAEVRLDAKAMEENKAYFDQTFNGLDCESMPNYDHKENEEKHCKIRLDLPNIDDDMVRALSKKVGVRRSSFFLAAYAYLLAKYSGSEDALFATVNNGRIKGEENTYGMFVKTLPLYAAPKDEMAIEDYLHEVDKTQIEAIEHSAYSFSDLNKDYAPRIDSLFAFQGEYFYSIGGKDVKVIPVKDGKEILATELFVREGKYFADVEFREDLYLESSIRHMFKIFEVVVNELLVKKTVGDIDMVDEEEKKTLDSFRPDELKEYEGGPDVVTSFLEMAKRYPDKLAIVGKGEKYTYAEVDDLSTRIADYLIEKGIKKNDVVSILSGRNAFMGIGPIGVLKSGAGYQPIDPGYPEERINFMIKDSEAKALIVQRGLETKLEKLPPHVIYLDEIPSLPKKNLPLPERHPDSLFVMLYTSGSTGLPKGVQLENGNLAIYLQMNRKYYSMTAEDSVAAYASFGFDANMMDTYSALTNGCTLHVIDEEMRLDLNALNRYFEENNITSTILTTQVGRQFVSDTDNHSLKKLTVGGEKLVPVEPPKNYQLYNGYGPTEVTIHVTAHPVDKLYYRVPIGKTLPTCHSYIVDKKLREVPYGVPGELCLSGPQVGRGYLHRDEENKKAFLTNPFDPDPRFKRFYRTGDIVRFLEDGTLDFIGRKDGMVKIRGFRIELSEVELVVRSYPGIKNATVVAFPAATGGSYLAAYVVSEEKVDMKDLKSYIASRKPYYMVPEAFLQLDEIPLNQNGKVNKRVLPEAERLVDEIVEPRNEVEAKSLQIARKIIGYDTFGVTANLFDAGLTSIASIKLITTLSAEFGMDVSIQDLHANPSIELLAQNVLGAKEEKKEYALQEDYPITKTQQGIFISCQKDPGSTVYNIPILYKLGENVDLAKLEKAVETAIDAHPYLKATLFSAPNGEVRAKRNDDKKANVQTIVVDSLPSPFPVRSMNLLGDQLYDARIIKTKHGNFLYLDTHHIVSDGTSLALLLGDINKAYLGETIEKEKLTGYEVGLMEAEASTPEAIEKQKERYKSIFGSLDCDSTPKKEYELPAEDTMQVYEADLKVDGKKIDAYLKKHRLTPNGFFNAAFALALAKWNGDSQALYTTIYSGRDKASLANSCVMLVKTLPVYANIDEKQDTLSFIQAISKQIQESESMTLYSFAEISTELGVDAEVMFAYQGDGFIPDEIGGEKATRIGLDSNDAKSAFSVDCLYLNGTYHLRFEYRGNLYKEETMVYFCRMMDTVCAEMTAKPRLIDLNYIDGETAEEMDVYNKTEDEFEGNTYLDEFAKRVKEDPSHVAVIGIDETITYEELDKRSNKVGNALSKLGTKEDDKVVVIMPRIANAYVAIHGVLKSGAAYLPIDPAYPEERVTYIISDSEAKIVITSKKIEKPLPLEGVNVLYVEDILASGDDSPLNKEINTHSLAYCIYTSGSTGKPKGVMIEHHSLLNYVYYSEHNEIAKEYKDLCSVCLALASLSFDLSVMEEFTPLANGLSVLLASEDEILNPLLLAKRMKQYGADFITTTPSYLNNVLDIGEVVDAFKGLHAIDIGAEALPVPLIAKLREKGITCPLHNGYGPTEATVSCTMDDVVSSRVTIGFPTNNVKCYIADASLHRLPFGAIGELLIAGEGVARGYIHREDLNKDRFITFEGLPTYRSGDLARINYDGRIEFFGRKDNQVKLRGLRVELDEIEAQMDGYPTITRSVVLVRETPKDGQFLVGYFTAKEEVDIASLKQHLSAHLTPYMVPKVFLQLDAIPLTNNGKVDKKALPMPEVSSAAASKKEAKMPRDELESQLYDIFKKVLGIDELSIDDDFFDLGGTSLSASKITMMAMEQGLPVSYSDVFDYSSVIELATNIKAMKKAAENAANLAPTAVKEEEKAAEPRPSLQYNCEQYVDEIGIDHPMKRVLLTGATGFLGVHVFRELYSKDVQILALVRPSKGISGLERLKGMIAYYFDEPFDEKFEHSVKVIESDVTSNSLIEELKGEAFDTIINCAALVKHFANDDSIERINTGGVKNLIEVALNKGCRLIQISTLSVAGENVNNKFPSHKKIHETELFFGQDLSNKYVNSKAKAEDAVLEAIETRGLDAKIIRVGNLMGRNSDGEFQINSVTNNFMNSLKAYKTLGCFPVSAADSTTDFSAIDEVAKTIVLLSKSSKQFTVFHSANGHELEMGDVMAALTQTGLPVKIVKDEEFKARLFEVLKDEKRNMLVSSLLSYDSSDSTRVSAFIGSDNSFTVKALYRLGYRWPVVDFSYLKRSIESLVTLGFFDE